LWVRSDCKPRIFSRRPPNSVKLKSGLLCVVPHGHMGDTRGGRILALAEDFAGLRSPPVRYLLPSLSNLTTCDGSGPLGCPCALALPCPPVRCSGSMGRMDVVVRRDGKGKHWVFFCGCLLLKDRFYQPAQDSKSGFGNTWNNATFLYFVGTQIRSLERPARTSCPYRSVLSSGKFLSYISLSVYPNHGVYFANVRANLCVLLKIGWKSRRRYQCN